ncbi:MAG: hypothetical protein E6G92_13945 [Alphaproteobacteria bacterium]|nr:MAG: hypothetical protein E6G92_13945 [Alphaproteobacteria bacterium]
MDNYREFGDQPTCVAGDDEPAMERPPEIGVDERRMHVRAYNYWVSLLSGRAYPSIQDLDPANIEDFGPHSVLLDFSRDAEDPEIAYLGGALRTECGLDAGVRRISEVPSRSLLSRLTDHYLQIIANSAPIGFEAEFVGQRGYHTMYRGILMPLSTDGETIDFIYGVINWKEVADEATASALAGQVRGAIAAAPAPQAAESLVWADGPHADFDAPEPASAEPDSNLSLWPENPGLGDRLGLARASAEEARDSDRRSRTALYRAIGLAHDFALAAAAEPDDYAELLEDSGIKAQARAPMTAIAKLVFGLDYDKTRLTEFAACLSWASRESVAEGSLAGRIEAHEGGLKGIVAAERALRRPAPKPDRWTEIRAELQAARPLARVDIAVEGDGEFVLLVARRESDGLAIVAPVSDARLVDQAIRKSAA